MLWDVEFSYTIQVEADTMFFAEQIASKEWNEKTLNADEMNIEVSNPAD